MCAPTGRPNAPIHRHSDRSVRRRSRSSLRSRHGEVARDRRKYHVDRQVAHAPVMTLRALTLSTGSAVDLQLEPGFAGVMRVAPCDVCRSEDCDYGDTKSGSKVTRPAVCTNEAAAAFHTRFAQADGEGIRRKTENARVGRQSR